jgi:hypothetical protein
VNVVTFVSSTTSRVRPLTRSGHWRRIALQLGIGVEPPLLCSTAVPDEMALIAVRFGGIRAVSSGRYRTLTAAPPISNLRSLYKMAN